MVRSLTKLDDTKSITDTETPAPQEYLGKYWGNHRKFLKRWNWLSSTLSTNAMVNVFTLLYRYLVLHCIVNKRESLLQEYKPTRLYYASHKHNSRAQTIKTKKVTMTKVFENVAKIPPILVLFVFRILWNGQAILRDDHPSANQFLYVNRVLSISSLIKSPARASIYLVHCSIKTVVHVATAPTKAAAGVD